MKQLTWQWIFSQPTRLGLVLIKEEENIVNKVFNLSFAIKDHESLGAIPNLAVGVSYNDMVMVREGHGVGLDEI